MIPKDKYIKFLGLFLLITGLSYFAFDYFLAAGSATLSPSSTQDQDSQDQVDPKTGYITFEGPKTEACPINGSLHTKEEKELWQHRRPLLIMIENHEESRPQSGLSNADIVYEAVAEGGITRLMAIFYCTALRGASQKYDIGPVRSARTYFLDIASEYSDYPLYTHVGGANCSAPKDEAGNFLACTTNKKAQALEQINQYGWTNKGSWSDLNQFSLSYRVCRREPNRTGQERATEHTMYCSTNQLWQMAEKRGLTDITAASKKSWDSNFTSWSFDQPDQASDTPTAKNISFDFWSGYKQYSVAWQYQSTTNSYLRFNHDQLQTDHNNSQSITAKNIIIQFAKETRSVDIHKHNLYQVIGRGTGILLQNGNKTTISWTKTDRTSRTIFKDNSGKQIKLVPGSTWVEILPIGATVDYEN